METRGTWSVENGLYLCPQLAKGPTSFQGRTLRVGIVDVSFSLLFDSVLQTLLAITNNGRIEAGVLPTKISFRGTVLSLLEHKDPDSFSSNRVRAIR